MLQLKKTQACHLWWKKTHVPDNHIKSGELKCQVQTKWMQNKRLKDHAIAPPMCADKPS